MIYMQTLTVTRGLPASGKSTWAIAQVQADPEGTVRVNRDSIRMMWFNSAYGTLKQEAFVNQMEHAMIRTALDDKRNVIVDATHLRSSHLRSVYNIAVEYNGDVQFRVMDFEIDVEESIERDSKRENPVGEEVIRSMSNRYMRGGSTLPEISPDIVPIEPNSEYIEDYSLPHAWLVDVDGTVASIAEGGRSPYDYTRVSEDDPVDHVINLVNILKRSGNRIIVMSGREDSCLEDTQKWLNRYGVPYDSIHMRKTGDGRRDAIVKSELFDAHIKGKFYIEGILDDRDQVVKMWRQRGLFVAQVNYGNF